jgi:hypothetical protein
VKVDEDAHEFRNCDARSHWARGAMGGRIADCRRSAAFCGAAVDSFRRMLAQSPKANQRFESLFGLRLGLAAEIYHLREPQKIPLVMSPDETRRLLDRLRLWLSRLYSLLISHANFANGSVTRQAPQRGTCSRCQRNSARRYR